MRAQEWLSFYFKSPMTAPELYRSTTSYPAKKLKKHLRWMVRPKI